MEKAVNDALDAIIEKYAGKDDDVYLHAEVNALRDARGMSLAQLHSLTYRAGHISSWKKAWYIIHNGIPVGTYREFAGYMRGLHTAERVARGMMGG